ncbi:SxtJ family membrane protein [Gimesia sp.]|uniref:SxtJ family membrane protein n=1 Tax=Gimesia sp. TaxID=2024833 RepID=UPI0032EC3A1D
MNKHRMMLIEINWNPHRRELRMFAVALACLCVLGGAFCLQRGAPGLLSNTLFGVTLVVLCVAWLTPNSMRPVYLLWMLLIYPLRWLVSCLLIAVVYYLVITPVGLIIRLSGRKLIEKHFDSETSSYWIPNTETRSPEDYFRQF